MLSVPPFWSDKTPGTGPPPLISMISKKRYYILLVSRGADGSLSKVPIPLHYAYMFVAVAVVGLFTITGLTGSYSRMLIKTSRFNDLRRDHINLQNDYAHLAETAHERDIQAASLGSLATEISALYGMTTSKLALATAHAPQTAAATAPLAGDSASFSNASYYKSLDTFYALRTSAISGTATRFLDNSAPVVAPAPQLRNSLNRIPGVDTTLDASIAPSLWPVMGPITSGFGQREDPVLGTGEGEFHKGVDISAPLGTPIRATADGMVVTAGVVNGYGREVVIDHGHGLKTCYGHMSGFNVLSGQTVFKGQIIGYVGHSGRTTGNHVHYEVRIHDLAVNPHPYLRGTIADLGGSAAIASR